MTRGVEGKGLDDLLAKLRDAKAPFEFGLDAEKGFPHKGTLAFGDNRIDPRHRHAAVLRPGR